MLRITFQESDDHMTMRLEGRIAGPWAKELNQAWTDAATRLGSKRLSIDLRSVSYADENGKWILRNICAQTPTSLVADTPWTQYLAREVADGYAQRLEEEQEQC